MNEEKLTELVKLQKKTLWSGRIRSILLVVIAAVLVFGVVTIVKNVETFNQTVSEFSTTVTDLATDFKGEIIAKIDSLELEQVDLEKVNTAVVALKDAANNLSKVDVGTLNNLVTELENVAKSLSNVTDGFKKIFGK